MEPEGPLSCSQDLVVGSCLPSKVWVLLVFSKIQCVWPMTRNVNAIYNIRLEIFTTVKLSVVVFGVS